MRLDIKMPNIYSTFDAWANFFLSDSIGFHASCMGNCQDAAESDHHF